MGQRNRSRSREELPRRSCALALLVFLLHPPWGFGQVLLPPVPIPDALFGPLEARQVVRAREADLRTAANDSLLAVTEAYFTVQQARGELAGALDAIAKTAELVRRTNQLAPGLVPPVEVVRAEAEL